MKTMATGLLSLLIASFLLSCENVKSAPPVEVALRVLDENLTDRTSFGQNEELILEFAVKNMSDKPLTWYAELPPEFFVVYRLDSPEGISKVGTPYKSFVSPSIEGLRIQPGDSFLIRISWTNPNNSKLSDWGYEPANNQPLTAGHYQTKLEFSLDFYGYEKFAFSKVLNFDVK